mgnify:CR=1 FL=1
MATLTGKQINNTYDGLLKTNDEQPLTANPKIIQDGEGNDSSFQLGTSGAKFTGYVTIENQQPILYLIDTNNNSDYYISNKNGKFEVFDNTNTATRLVIDSTGKVGVGNGLTIPQADFHVLGDFLVESGYPKISLKDTNFTSHEFNIVGNDGSFSIEGVFTPASIVTSLFEIQQQQNSPQYKFRIGSGSFQNAYLTVNPAGFSQGSMYLGAANFAPTLTVEADSVGLTGHTAVKVIRHNTDATSEDSRVF